MSDVTRFLVDQSGSVVPYGDMSPTAMKRAYDKIDQINYIKSRIRATTMADQNNTNFIPIVVNTYRRLITKIWMVEDRQYQKLLKYVFITKKGKIRLARNEDEIEQSKAQNRSDQSEHRSSARSKRKYIQKHFLNEDDIQSYLTLFQSKYPFVTWQAMANVTTQFKANLPTLVRFVADAIRERIGESFGERAER